MAESSLFAHLALRFGTDPETVAAEALIYLLERSAAARAGLLGACAVATPGIPSLLTFRRRQEGAEDLGPGIVGAEADGAIRLMLTPKFWRGLSERQPVDDVRALASDRASAVVVVAPAGRFTTLWAELRRRCRLAGVPVHGDHAAGDPMRWTRAGTRRTLILVSWNALLAGVRASVAAAGEESLAREVDQLAALCGHLDSDAFLPLSADELAAATPRRLRQLLDLVDDLATACERRGLGRIAERDAAASPGAYSRGLRLGPTEFRLIWSVTLWATVRETPFWLRVAPVTGGSTAQIEQRLKSLSYEVPPRLLRDPAQGHPLVPLFPLLGAEREAVLTDLVDQIEAVARLLDEAPTIGFGSVTRPVA